jgi:glutamyl-tRNA synthetase
MSAVRAAPRHYVGRLAPSPTGALHLGNVRTFAIAWLRARAAGGRVVLRIEDLDHPKDKPGADREAVEDLEWLGFDWDETFRQSERRDIYRAALDRLVASGFAYPCVCSRRDVESAQSAPHSGEQLRYAGACRGRFAGWDEAFRFLNPPSDAPGRPPRLPCWRFRVDGGTRVEFEDAFAGRFSMDVAEALGDFPLARDPDGAGYTLAVVVDDAAMGVTEVVRGDDLLPATPAQILVQRALGLPTPSYCHVPLVVGPDGRRLAKRHGDTRIAAFREAGAAPEDVIGVVAASCGWHAPGGRASLEDLLGDWSMDSIPRSPFVFCTRAMA